MNEDIELDAFDDDLAVALACTTLRAGAAPRPDVRRRLLAQIAAPPLPAGFRIERAADDTWRPYPVPGIRMKVLSVNHPRQQATLLLDVAPGTRFPAHHHDGAEDCYVLAGSLDTCGRHLIAGDFIHAEAGTDHTELRSDEGCQVLLIVPLDEHLGTGVP